MMMSSRVGVLIDRRVRALQRALLLEGTRPFFLDEDTKKRFRVFCYPKYFYARRLPLLLYCFFLNYAHANARRFRRRIQPPEYCIVVIVAPSSFTSSSSSRRPFLQPKKSSPSSKRKGKHVYAIWCLLLQLFFLLRLFLLLRGVYCRRFVPNASNVTLSFAPS